MHQKPKLASSSEEYKEEDSHFSLDNNQKSTVKKLSLVENVKKRIRSSDSEEELVTEEENNLFICKTPEVCELLEEKKFDQRKVMDDCLMMNYWCRSAIKYIT